MCTFHMMRAAIVNGLKTVRKHSTEAGSKLKEQNERKITRIEMSRWYFNQQVRRGGWGGEV